MSSLGSSRFAGNTTPVLGSIGSKSNRRHGVRSEEVRTTRRGNERVVTEPVEDTLPTPSQFHTTMKMSTEQFLSSVAEVRPPKIIEFMDIGEFSSYKDTGLSVDVPLFQPFPSDVRFQSFNPQETYKVPLVLRNMDRVARRIKVLPSDSPYFRLVPKANGSGGKIAPGMEVVYEVIFTPDQYKDYVDEIVCLTEREKFVIPIRAIGARAMLDFPDSVTFKTCPVKHTSTKVLLVRNIGTKNACFSVATEAPFSVTPSASKLDVNGSMQIEVGFKPLELGSHSCNATVTYDTGEKVEIQLYGAAEDANVRLDKNTVGLEKTYIGQSSLRTLKIQNRSDIVAHFEWKAAATSFEEVQERIRLTEDLDEDEDAELSDFQNLMGQDPTLRDQMALLTRKYKTKRQQVTEEGFTLEDDTFILDPPSGDIWPNSEIEVSVAFRPTDAAAYSRTVYCDITGRETRLPLKLRGEGMGPQMRFSFESLDMGKIFVGSSHTYEVVLQNVGDIDGHFKLNTPTSLLGSCFEFSPVEGVVPRGGFQAIRISFRSVHLGRANEDITLSVAGSPQSATQSINITGDVIGPTFRFDVAEVDFDRVAYGFVSSRRLSLINTSLVPMTYTLHFADDCDVKGDFEIDPAHGTISANDRADINIDLIATSVCQYDTYISVDVEGVGKNLLTVPVFATSVVPDVHLANPLLDFGRCFLGLAEERKLQLVNSSDLPASFDILPFAQHTGAATFECATHGIIEAGSAVDVDIALTAGTTGDILVNGLVEIAGQPERPLEFKCGALGEGPVLSVSPVELKWGKQEVLKSNVKEIRLSNESEIPATFECLLKKGEVFKCTPSSGMLEPGAAVILEVAATLDDTIAFSDMMVVAVSNGCALHVPLHASGSGTTIWCQERLGTVDFGKQFSQDECVKTYTLVNKGRRQQKLVFKLDSPLPGVSGECTVMRGAAFEKKRTPACPNPPAPRRSHFGIWPEQVVLEPHDSVDIEIRGICDLPSTITETFLCMGSIEKQAKQRVLFTTEIAAEFINPLLEMSARQIKFTANQSLQDGLGTQSQQVTLTNVLDLPLSVSLSFSNRAFVLDGDAKLAIAPGATSAVKIVYDPLSREDSNSRKDLGDLVITYDEHPQVDSIKLLAEVFYPNLAFSADAVNFGCVPNGTRDCQVVELTNPSLMPVELSWQYDERTARNTEIEQVFDIVPMKAKILPGETLRTKFFFHGHPNCVHRTVAQCTVVDGPVYSFKIEGSAATQSSSLSHTNLNFGNVLHNKFKELSFDITNTGMVDVPFKTIVCPAEVTFTPSEGVVAAKETATVIARFAPSKAEVHSLTALLQISHDEPQALSIAGTGVYPTIAVDSPDAPTKLTDSVQLEGGTTSLSMGPVIRGESMTKEIVLTNTFAHPVTIKVLRKKLQSEYLKAFSIEPDEIVGLPAGASSTVKAKFMSTGTRRTVFPLGAYERTLPLQVIDGPRINVRLSANVCEPVLELSSKAVDFGDVKVGECKVMEVQLHNPTEVTACWNAQRRHKKLPAGMSKVAKAAELRKREEAARFIVFPQAGTLVAGETTNITVRYTPLDDLECTTHIPVKVEQSTQKQKIVCKGRGLECLLEFVGGDTMGPILPYSKGDEKQIIVKNNSDFPIEFFSEEYDATHEDEEDILASLTEYDNNGQLMLPPRKAGEPLPQELLRSAIAAEDEVAIAVDQDEDDAVFKAPGEDEDANAMPLAPTPAVPETGVGEVQISPVQAAVDRYLGVDVKREKFQYDHGGFNAIVHGPAFAGKHSQAYALAAKYEAAPVSVDEIVENAMHLHTVLGDQARTYLMEKEAARLAALEEPPVVDTKKKTPAKEEPAEDPDAQKFPEIRYESAAGLPPPSTLDPDLLFELIKDRVGRQDALDGVVICGLQSKYAPFLDVLGLLLRALNKRSNLYFVWLDTDTEVCRDRIMKMHHEKIGTVDFAAEVKKIQAVTEEEYENMNEVQQAEFDRKQKELKDKLREVHHEQRMREERKRMEEQLRKEEENKNSKGKGKTSRMSKVSNTGKNSMAPPSGAATTRSLSIISGDGSSLGHQSPEFGSNCKTLSSLVPENEVAIGDHEPPIELQLLAIYELSLPHINRLLSCWDVSTGSPVPAYVAPEDEVPVDDKATAKKMKQKSTPNAGKAAPEEDEEPPPKDTPDIPLTIFHVGGNGTAEDVAGDIAALDMVTPISVLRALGKTNDRPGIADPINYWVVNKPVPRASGKPNTVFTFFDPEIRGRAIADAKAAAEAEAALAAEEEANKSTKGKKGGRPESRTKKESSRKKSASDSSKGKRGSSGKRPPAKDDFSELAKIDDTLKTATWIIPAKSELVLNVRFRADTAGVYDQTFNFESMVSQRKYSVFVRGICEYPFVAPVPETHTLRHGAKNDELPFGPVLVGLPREEYKAGACKTANDARVMLTNPSDKEVTVSAGIEGDTNFTCFTCDPQAFTIPPHSEMALRVWAYPRETHPYNDRLVVCIKDNPVPIIYPLSCQGVKPELECDTQTVQFDRVLVRRKDTRSIILTNKCPLPVKWICSGLEQLTEDFDVPVSQGVIEGNGTYELIVHFRATRPINTKKSFKIEYYDTNDIIGLVNTFAIAVQAEAYDLVLSLVFPKGCEESKLDFEKLRVGDEKALVCTLKNRGKYDVRYMFSIDKTVLKKIKGATEDIISVFPSSGELKQADNRALNVKFVLKPHTEVVLDQVPLLRCEIIDPNINETIARIPVVVSARAVYSQYSVTPSRGINFGPHEYPWNSSAGGRLKVAPRDFVIKNTGEFEFRYNINKVPKVTKNAKMALGGNIMSGNSFGAFGGGLKPAGGTLRRQSNNLTPSGREPASYKDSKFSVQCFTVSRSGGVIAPGASEKISVEVNDPTGIGKEEAMIYVDIEHREESDNPAGFEYKLGIEACRPQILSDDFYSIFCEHPVVTQVLDIAPSEPTFVVDTKQFLFGNVPLGKTVSARVRVHNPTRIECDVAVKYAAKKTRSRQKGAVVDGGFTVEPAHVVVPPHEYSIVNITFSPIACQAYLGDLEIVLDSKTHDTKSLPEAGSRIHFEVAGDGALPRVTLIEPAETVANGSSLMQFRRTYITQQRKHGVVVRNDGPLPARVLLELVPLPADRPVSRTGARQQGSKKSSGTRRKSNVSEAPPTVQPNANARGQATDGVFTVVGDGLPVEVPVGGSVTLDVSFGPTTAKVYNANLRLTTFDNQYDSQYIEVAGEGFAADTSIEGLPTPGVIAFGDTALCEAKERNFQLLNHSDDTLRFDFTQHKDFDLSPSMGFLDAKATKTITAAFHPTHPCDYRAAAEQVDVQCNLKKVKAVGDASLDWDDSRKVLKWVVAEGPGGILTRTQISEVVAEPKYDEVAPSAPHVLKASGVSDYSKFEVKSLEGGPLTEAAFRETLMFQTRDYAFNLHNTGSVALNYDWSVAEDALDASAEQYMPFAVEPAVGEVPPGQVKKITVKFAPLDSGEFGALATCSVMNAHPDLESPRLDLWGVSKRPFCHFELPQCDYVSGGRRDKNLKGPTGIAGQLDPSTRVFELTSVGVGKVKRASFFMTNPVDVDYNFSWKCLNIDASLPNTKGTVVEMGPFRILNARGCLKSGKKVEIAIEFVPLHLQVTESFWTFSIPEHNIEVPFLIVGRALEPRVSTHRNVLQLMPLLVGQTLKETIMLRNDEDTPFRFNWRTNVIENLHVAANVSISPLKGVMEPKSTMPISVLFSPKLVQPYNFQLFCDIKKKPSPLIVNIRCDSYAVKSSLTDEDMKRKVDATAAPVPLNFGSIAVYDNVSRAFVLQNSGDHPFDFDWHVQRKKLGETLSTSILTVTPARGSLEAGGRQLCHVRFAQTTTTPVALQDVAVTCKVSNGPTYKLSVSAIARLPQIKWSFTNLKFGKVLVYQHGMQAASKALVITNEDTEQVSIACALPDGHGAVFQMDFTSSTIQPGEQLEIPIRFTPTEARTFNMPLDFIINSRTTQRVDVSGTGVLLRLAVKGAPQRVLRFGSIRVGKRCTKEVEVVNQTVIPVEFAAMGDLQGLSENNLSISPTHLIKLKPQESFKLNFTFEPKRRIAEFTEQICAELVDQRVPLLDVVGACQGVQLEMDNDQISFGTATVHSRATRRVLLNNTGDIGAKFLWKLPDKAKEWFSVVPETGYLSPGLEVILTIIFHPGEAKSEVRFEGIECEVENGAALFLDLAGNAVPQKAQSDTLAFQTQVRHADSKTVKVENKTAHDWNLIPKLEHPYFSGPNRLHVPAGGVASYTFTYLPLVMNQFPRERGGGHQSSKEDAHVGSLFFALPDGGTLMYNLQGYSSAPKPEQLPILRDIQCKTQYTELLPVKNWLTKPQRFKLHIKLLKTASTDTATRLDGLDYIDVPGSATREYKLNFYAYREGTTQAEVVLKNEETGEYLSYDVTFKALPAGVLETIRLNACVRSVARGSVKIFNPIMSPVTISMATAYTNTNGASSACNEVHGPSLMRLPAAPRAGQPAAGVYTFDFLPLLEGKRTARLTLSSAELGLFQYDLVLNATPHGHLPVEKFTAFLGEAVTHKYKFTNYNPTRGDYQISVDHPAFTVPTSITTVPATKPVDVEFEMSFEPAQLGSVKAMMVISSKAGGVYNCPLFGECAPPRPSGPFVVRTGHSAKTSFKNVFDDSVDYTYTIDNPAFSLHQDTMTYRAKESKDIMFKYDQVEGGSNSAKLNVTASTGPHTGTQWVFYLSGTQ